MKGVGNNLGESEKKGMFYIRSIKLLKWAMRISLSVITSVLTPKIHLMNLFQ